jgi:hypothetical protein
VDETHTTRPALHQQAYEKSSSGARGVRQRCEVSGVVHREGGSRAQLTRIRYRLALLAVYKIVGLDTKALGDLDNSGETRINVVSLDSD